MPELAGGFARGVLLILAALLVTAAGGVSTVRAEDAPWSTTVGAGYFMPGIEGWKDQYGRSGGWMPEIGAGYAVTRFAVVSAEAGYFTSESFARAAPPNPPLVSGERQRLVLWPVTVGIEVPGRFSANQTVVPFLQVAYRRVAYRLEVTGKDSVRGGAGGVVAGAGIDVLLNPFDAMSASRFADEYGVVRTSLRIQGQWSDVKAPGAAGPDVDLGGKALLIALKFDF